MASVNVTKIMRNEFYPELSTGLLKAYLSNYLSNIYMFKRILARSGLRPNRTLNAKLVKELFGFVTDAA